MEPLQKWLALEPEQSGAWRDLGWSLLAHNRLPEAIEAWDRALRYPTADPRRLIRQLVGGLAEEGQDERARELFRRWEPEGPFLAMGLELLDANRILAARVFLASAWDAGEQPERSGLCLAYAEAHAGTCSPVPEHLAPFVRSGPSWDDPRDRNAFLGALFRCSQEPGLFPILIELDQHLVPAAEADPEVLAILVKGAAERRRAGEGVQAWLLYRKVLVLDPDRVRDWLPAAETAVDLGLRLEALALLKSLEMRTRSAAVREGIRGWLADTVPNREAAVRHYQNSLQDDPLQPDLRYRLFQDLIALNHYAPARSESRWFEEHVAAGEVQLKGYLAETLTALGKNEEALPAWQELYLANPGKAHYAVETARTLFRLGRASEAGQILETLLAETPDAKAIELAAEIQRDLARPGEIMTLTEKGISTQPTTGLWQLRAEAAEVQKQAAPALEAAQAWLAADPGSTPASLIQAKALIDLDRTDEARDFLEALLRRSPVFVPGLIQLREIASRGKQPGN